MERYETKDIRNIAFFGHGASGKTSLLEAVLHEAKATNRLGSVDDGTSVSDFDPEEKERHFSIDTSLFHFKWQGREVNAIDTPGYPDFVQGVISSLSVVETAIIVVSATNGLQVNTQKIWNLAGEAGLARIIILTKMDGENIDFLQLVNSLQETFGQECLPLVLPVGCGDGFKGVVNLLNLPDQVPVDVVGDVVVSREKLVEGIVSVCDEQLERYLDGQKIEIEKLEGCFSAAVASGGIVPILCCENRGGLGVKEAIEVIAKFAPSPEKDVVRKCVSIEGEEKEIADLTNNPFSAQVFKSITDPFVGKLSFFRVYSGTLEKHPTVFNPRTQKSEKIGHMFRTFGKEQEEIASAVPGDIVTISKVEDISVSDTLCDPHRIMKFDDIKFPNPMVSLAVKPKSLGAEQKIGETLHRLVDEDRTCMISRDIQTHELVITGMSSLHLGVILNRLKRRFHIEVETSQPKIPYKETITLPADAQYKHKKQTGGKGQYGEVYVRIEPLQRGGGFEFKSEIVGGAIPGQYIPPVEKGIRETLEKGILSGNQIVDVKVVLYDGSFHNVDSSEAAFKIAASKAFQSAFQKAKPVLLEPIVDLEITIPPEFMGDVTGAIASRRGRVQGMDSFGDLQVVKVSISLAEVANYETELKSMTHGRGSYTMEFSHYDVVPSHLAQGIIAQAEKGDESEH
ncbi:MAG: elongation factor G [Candidatus Scalindua sp. AMX11]|nr:MAG: elongation factor G [Candidatus Scalindua sp.]NOG85637.1 elongation factor G [Planctomycetota bacterium]RZV82466.1 MAG: elongation factor G [Candidatus Scalindua sp. SCAELEC01]TDE65609.1 MAG: elongation factor G [Candidatus Scalindua sp. AMX11]GJQ59196.1 MAG: elongation factor G [Candidatus Scalindua sp.]